MPKRQRLLSLDTGKSWDAVEIATLQFLARRTQGLTDAEFVLMLRRLARCAAEAASLTEMCLMRGEEL